MTDKKPTKKATVKFEHRDTAYFLFTKKIKGRGTIMCQFMNHFYETSDELEIALLRDYCYNQSNVREV